MTTLLILRDAISLALILTAAVWFFRHAIADRLRTAWRNFRHRLMPTGPQDNARLAKLYREGKI
ncbi:MAG: hypothetical protein WCO94_11160 [Verrucomicrobiota bacterium]